MTERRIVAKFVPQVWINDYAVSVDAEGCDTFDVTDSVLALGREAALALRNDTHESDTLRFSSNAPQWVRDWQGPFYIDVEQSIAEYFET